jgi:hypothetical protein
MKLTPMAVCLIRACPSPGSPMESHGFRHLGLLLVCTRHRTGFQHSTNAGRGQAANTAIGRSPDGSLPCQVHSPLVSHNRTAAEAPRSPLSDFHVLGQDVPALGPVKGDPFVGEADRVPVLLS